uniref:OCEL domain-containing protein n=1 Tax=Macrostomum lignano TaxID=282301 RepID=A0A1I8GEP6_9PLAT
MSRSTTATTADLSLLSSGSSHMLRGLSASASTRCLLHLRLTDAALRSLVQLAGDASVNFVESSTNGVVGFLSLSDGSRLNLMSNDPSEDHRPTDLVRFSHKSQSATRLGRLRRRLTVDAAAQQLSMAAASSVTSSAHLATEPTLRDRLLHLLAARPLTRPELLARLRADGFAQPDPVAVASLLAQLAKLQGEGRGYGLRPCMYREVRPDSWPGYSDTERVLVKRRAAEAAAAVAASTTASTGKEKSVAECSNFDRASSSGVRSGSGAAAAVAKQNSIMSTITIITTNNNGEECCQIDIANLANCDLVDLAMDIDVSDEDLDEDDDIEDPFNEDECSGTDVPDDSTASVDTGETGRWHQRRRQRRGQSANAARLKPIRSVAQRTAYKSLYDRHYPEYRRLWERVRSVSDEAAVLETRLAGSRPGSLAHSEASAAIVRLYQRYRYDAGFRGDTRRCGRLQRRLKRLRQMIENFDAASGEESARAE